MAAAMRPGTKSETLEPAKQKRSRAIMMMTGVTTILATSLLAADNEVGQILNLVIILGIGFGSAIIGWIKKKQEEAAKQNQDKQPTPPIARQPQQRPSWPSAGTGTADQPRTGPVPPTTPRPQQPQPSPRPQPPVVSLPGDGRTDAMRGRIERVEAEIRRRAEKVEQARKQKVHQAQAAKTPAAAPTADRKPTLRPIADEAPGPSRQIPQHLQRLLASRDLRAAIMMSEILGPPLALRDPAAQVATTPPGLAS